MRVGPSSLARRGEPTVRQAFAEAVERLGLAGVQSARLDARLLLCRATGLSAADLVGRDRFLESEEQGRFENLLQRRLNREPLARILGEQEFWSLLFKLSPATLIPRPDTETVVEAVLNRVDERSNPVRILDLGTGSGCLLLSLLHELPLADGLGTDLSLECLLTARGNAERLGLGRRARFIRADWADCVAGRFDIVVSNPPYIADDQISGLEPEVSSNEPRLALAGGADGQDAYRRIADALPRLLSDEGLAFLEIGFGAAEPITAILEKQGLRVLEVRADLAGVPRCVTVAAQKRQNGRLGKKF